MTSRLEYTTPSKYSNKVLIGSWYNERFHAHQPPQEKSKYSTTYDRDFYPKPVKKPDYTLMWDQILDAESTGLVSDLEASKSPNYYNNFSTSYDLSYNHFPKCYKTYIPRIWQFIKGHHIPQNEYLPTFGNITKSGTVDQKNIEWGFEGSELRRTKVSSYKCEFKPPELEDYDFKRFVTPRNDFESLTEEDMKNFWKTARSRCVRDVVNSTLLCAHKGKYCNPITWECTPDMKIQEAKRCVQ